VHVVATRLESALGSRPRSAPESAAAHAAASAAEPSLPGAAEFAPRPPALAALPRMSRDFC
jgi:hypothetical protein